MSDRIIGVRAEQLENWLQAFQCGPTTQNRAMEEMERALNPNVSEISPCPCCGNSAFIIRVTGGPTGAEYFVLCDGCMLQTKTYPEAHMAAEAWNKRAGALHPIIQTLHNNGDLIALEATVAQQAEYIRLLEEEKAKGWKL